MRTIFHVLSMCLATSPIIACDQESNGDDAPLDADLLAEQEHEADEVELLDGLHGAPVIQDGELVQPESVLRWPDGSQVDIYMLGGSIVVSAKTPVDSPYRALINQARGVTEVADLFAVLAPTKPLPDALRAPTSREPAAPVSRGTYTEEALAHLAARGVAPVDLESRLRTAATQSPASEREASSTFTLRGETSSDDGCWYTDWFLYYIATQYPFPAIPQTCWWHSSPDWEMQYAYGANYGNYEFAFMNDQGPIMTAIVIFQRKYSFFDKSNWIYVQDLSQGWATSFWWLGAGGWSNFGYGWIYGTEGASHMAYEFY